MQTQLAIGLESDGCLLGVVMAVLQSCTHAATTQERQVAVNWSHGETIKLIKLWSEQGIQEELERLRR